VQVGRRSMHGLAASAGSGIRRLIMGSVSRPAGTGAAPASGCLVQAGHVGDLVAGGSIDEGSTRAGGQPRTGSADSAARRPG
jgi:hypothetical protein